MKCAECGTEMLEGSFFCGNCGAPLALQKSVEPDSTLVEAGLTQPSLPALQGWLVVELGAEEGQRFLLQGTMRIGRTEDNEIVLDDAQISRHHAAVSREVGGYSLQDLNSTNGTFLGDRRINSPHALKDGDQIRVGDTTLVFRWLPAPTAAPLSATGADPATIAAPWPPSDAEMPARPQQGKARESGGLPVGVVVLGALLAVLMCAVIAVGLYSVLGRQGTDLPFLSFRKTASTLVTQVVTSAPAKVVTMVVTPADEPTPTVLSTDTPIPGPVTVRVAPDGSGDYSSLEAAVEAVPPRSTIHLDPGTYRLVTSLEISKSLSLMGAGMDETFVAGSAGDQVVLFTGPGVFSTEGITFRYEGVRWARVMTIDDGEIEIARCRFTGGAWSEEEEKGGDGLLLWGNTTGSVRESRFEGNQLHGIELQDASHPWLEENAAVDNGQNGIMYWDDSGGTALENECRGNGINGIGVSEQAQPILEGNVCKDNDVSGIRFSDTAGGTARRNECTGNGSQGIVVRGEAQPTLEGNNCTGNAGSGIVYFDQAAGMARQNISSENGLHGISVNDQAQPTLEANNCIGNAETGIAYFEQAAGIARQNTSAENGLHGISVNGQAQPTLEDNISENNTEIGIRFTDNSGGMVRNNRSTGNNLHGFSVHDQASPTLEGNISSDNMEVGLAYFGSAGGVARNNTCTGNKWGIYVTETASPELADNDCRDNSEADVDDRRVPAKPTFGPITFARDKTEDNEPIDPTTVFPSGTTEVHAVFSYEGMNPDLEWSRTWYRDGEEQVAKTENWSGDERGTYGLRYFDTEGNPLAPGNYELHLYIQGNLVQNGTFVVEE